jgi:hypothetical protein
MITTAGKTRVTGFHCMQLDKAAYKALCSFMELMRATTEEALQTMIQFAAHSWQSPQGRQRTTEMVQKWKNQRPREEITLHSVTLD